jgi:RHS repeat-associated protein
MNSRTINSGTPTSFTYTGNEMSEASGTENFTLGYDLNGNLTTGRKDANTSVSLAYNWDNKLQSATIESNSISIKYDPAGNRVYKASSAQGTRKYIVDVVGDLPVILLELQPTGNSIFEVKKAYIYANSQILVQYDGADKYYYLHDRLGSVRQLINTSGAVVMLYTYNPYGETIEEQGTVDNDFKFTGQFYDKETGQYYLRARQYSPYLARFTGRDFILGDFESSLTLHKYLYCQNDPVNKLDPTGKWRTRIHDKLIGAVFPGLSHQEQDYIEQGSLYVDLWFQSEKYSYMHAMRAPNESVGHAENEMQGFVQQHLQAYKDDLFLGELFEDEELIANAYFELGMALHPVMDSTDPLHEGFQIWWGLGDERGREHIRNEPIDISLKQRQRTIRLMIRTINSGMYIGDNDNGWGG